MDLERALRSIGKRCFRNCYEIASRKGESLTIDDLLQNDPDLIGTKESGLRIRLSYIKPIFKEGLQDEALRLANSAKNYDGN